MQSLRPLLAAVEKQIFPARDEGLPFITRPLARRTFTFTGDNDTAHATPAREFVAVTAPIGKRAAKSQSRKSRILAARKNWRVQNSSLLA